MRSMGTRSAWGFSIWTSIAMPSNAWTRGTISTRTTTNACSPAWPRCSWKRASCRAKSWSVAPGHVRMPGYIRGKTGVVVSESPAYPFPDAHAHSVEAADEPTYDVRFRTEDLWPNSAEPALVHAGVTSTDLVRRLLRGIV